MSKNFVDNKDSSNLLRKNNGKNKCDKPQPLGWEEGRKKAFFMFVRICTISI